ncbi:TetR/AcrR family transcriptional regulator [Streptomyces sp. NPDC127039]|uniref:TetR/AcrR family transcriptional regulator n=1 Tax=Streptomyces sp. NPDC127039 TaxID=3347115 RepID=UPI00365911EC
MAERRRGAELESALLDAAWEELVDVGYVDFTLDGVASRAGTSRPVIHRRWSDKRQLMIAALAHTVDRHPVSVPDTGSLRGDVLALLRDANATRAHFVTAVGIQLAAYYRETGTTPAELREHIHAGRRPVVEVVFDRAADRGEIDPGRVTARMKSLPFDLLRHELLTTSASVADATLEEIVDTLFLPLVLTSAPAVHRRSGR